MFTIVRLFVVYGSPMKKNLLPPKKAISSLDTTVP